jgi:hypothetical protein
MSTRAILWTNCHTILCTISRKRWLAIKFLTYLFWYEWIIETLTLLYANRARDRTAIHTQNVTHVDLHLHVRIPVRIGVRFGTVYDLGPKEDCNRILDQICLKCVFKRL